MKDTRDEFGQDLDLLLAEVGELLAVTEESLVELEKSPETPIYPGTLRIMHTIKGGPRPWGFRKRWT